jgi:hypothetical protein
VDGAAEAEGGVYPVGRVGMMEVNEWGEGDLHRRSIVKVILIGISNSGDFLPEYSAEGD